MSNNSEPHSIQRDLHSAVRAARIELASAIEALTGVLEAAANSEPDKKNDSQNSERGHHGFQNQLPPSSSSQAQRNPSLPSSQRPEQLPLSSSVAIASTQNKANAQLPSNTISPSQLNSQQHQQPGQLPQQLQQIQQQQVQQLQQQQSQVTAGQVTNQSGQQSSNTQPGAISLEPVLIRLNNLRSSVNVATRLHDETVKQAQKQDMAVPPQERAALEARRDSLVDEVHAKNERMKLLIDHLRELYRDSLTFRNDMKVVYPRHGSSSTKN